MTDKTATAGSQLGNVVGFPDNDDEAPLIPEGEYRFRLESHYSDVQFGNPKLILNLKVTDFGPFLGTKLKAYFNVVTLLGKSGMKGKVKHKRTGGFMVQYFTVLPMAARIKRLDRVPMEPLYNIEIVGKVRTVKLDSKQKRTPEQCWYSVVARLVRAEK